MKDNGLVMKLMEDNRKYIWKMCFEYCNPKYSSEDLYQIVALKTIEWLGKEEDLINKNIFDLRRIHKKVVHDAIIDEVRKALREIDSSIYKLRVDDIKEYRHPVDPSNPIGEFETGEIANLIEDRVRIINERKGYSGIYEFFLEAINPSEETLALYEDYKKSKTRVRNSANGYLIPPFVLAKLLGISRNKMYKYRSAIWEVCKELFPNEDLASLYKLGWK
jgi:DNA-directed RNA polymerase specialized sigma24 family protein